jgi:hypothetical protein
MDEHPGIALDQRDVEAGPFELEGAQGTINRNGECHADCVVEVLSADDACPDQHVGE